MTRRIVGTGLASLLVLVLVAGCGGADPSPSPAPSEATPTEASSAAPVATEAPPASEPAATGAGEAVRMTALCGGVAVRTGPSTDDRSLVRVAAGTRVRVVETVVGDPYEAGSCGTGGDAWLKVDRVNGTSVERQYGVPFGYVAAGFFE